jgi:hypothetical protein
MGSCQVQNQTSAFLIRASHHDATPDQTPEKCEQGDQRRQTQHYQTSREKMRDVADHVRQKNRTISQSSHRTHEQHDHQEHRATDTVFFPLSLNQIRQQWTGAFTVRAREARFVTIAWFSVYRHGNHRFTLKFCCALCFHRAFIPSRQVRSGG